MEHYYDFITGLIDDTDGNKIHADGITYLRLIAGIQDAAAVSKEMVKNLSAIPSERAVVRDKFRKVAADRLEAGPKDNTAVGAGQRRFAFNPAKKK